MSLLLGIILQSCSTDVDLYADYKDITIVYGLLDPQQDTNFIKINKAFLGPGNAFEIAQIPDSCNYPGKLDCKIIEYRAPISSTFYEKTREFWLDTITIHDKEPGLFYAPDQLVYYTTERINANSRRFKYRYDLQIDRGDTLLTSSTDVVGGEGFAILNPVLDFSNYSDTKTLRWNACPNAFVYDVKVNFYYTEIIPSGDSIPHCIEWRLREKPIQEAGLDMENGSYSLSYSTFRFFSNLADEMGSDTLDQRIQRKVFEPSLEVIISAGGEELNNFIVINEPSNSVLQNIPEYTNISGGYGVFSSRTHISRKMRLSTATMVQLINNHPNWNFSQGR